MNDRIIRPPTERTRAICNACEQLIRAYLTTEMRPESIRRFESEVEYYTLIKLMIRHFESLIYLCRYDLVTAPSANVIARSIFECGVRARWMFIPIDPFEREVRWVLHLRSGAIQSTKLASSKFIGEQLIEHYKLYSGQIIQFEKDITKLLLERGYDVPKHAPNLWEMLKELDEPELYTHYILLSSYSHSNFEAASLFRKNLGGAKKIGEFTSESDWNLPFYTSFRAFYHTSREFLALIDSDVGAFDTRVDVSGFEKLIRTDFKPN